MANATRLAGPRAASPAVPTWLNVHEVIDEETCKQIEQLITDLEAVEPTIRSLAERSFHLLSRADLMMQTKLYSGTASVSFGAVDHMRELIRTFAGREKQ